MQHWHWALLAVLVSIGLLVPVFTESPVLGHSPTLLSNAGAPATANSPTSPLAPQREDSTATSTVSAGNPSVLETVSLCNGTVLQGFVQTICSPNGPTAIIYDPVSHFVFLANAQTCVGCTDYVIAYNATTDQEVWTYITGSGLAGQTPMAMTVDPTVGTLFVADRDSNSVSVVNGTTGLGIANVTVYAPTSLAYDPAKGLLYVAHGNLDVSALYPFNGTFLANYSFAASVSGVLYDPATSDLYADSTSGDVLYVANGTTGALLSTLGMGSGPDGMVFDPASGAVYVANSAGDNVTVVSGSSLTSVGSVTGLVDPAGLAYDSSNRSVYAAAGAATNELVQIKTSTNTVGATVSVSWSTEGQQPVAYDLLTNKLYLSPEGGFLRTVDPSTNYTLGAVVPVDPSDLLSVPALGEAFVADGNNCDLIPINLTTSESGTPFASGCKPMGVAYDPVNDELYISNYGRGGLGISGNVTVVNATTHAFVARVSVGLEPSGLAYDATDNRVFVAGYYNISVIDPTTNHWKGNVYNITAGGSQLEQLTWDPENDFVYFTSGPMVGALNASTEAFVKSVDLRGVLAGTALDPDNDELFVAQTDDQHGATDNVTVLDANNLTRVVTLAPCSAPAGAVYDPVVHLVYVACSGSGTVGVIDPANDMVESTVIGVPSVYAYGGDAPNGLFLDGAGGLIGAWDAQDGSLFIISPGAGWYVTQFRESGLPWSTPWSVDLNSTLAAGETTALSFLTGNGSAFYLVGAVSGYVASPSAGIVVINGTNLTTPVTYSLPTFGVTFQQSGLSIGTGWSVTVGDSTVATNASTVGFALSNGTYSYSIASPTGFLASPDAGFLTVAGASLTVDVDFNPSYPLTFTETGLASGTYWSVEIGTTTESSTNATISSAETNGSYAFRVVRVNGFFSSPRNGTVDVAGGPANVTITFSPAPPSTYAITFIQSGLPSGTPWSVKLGSSTENSSTPSIVFSELNGTYGYAVNPRTGYIANPAAGSVIVVGAAQDVPVSFTAVPPAGNSVEFTEAGLVPGTDWSVTLGGTTVSSFTGQIFFSQANGTYPFTVGAVPGFTPKPASGSVTVSGRAVTQTVVFTENVSSYSIYFVEAGLAPGTNWSVTLAGGTLTSTSTTLGFTQPNGTYAYTVSSIAGYTSNRTGGSVTVSGAARTLRIGFSAVPARYALTFSEVGLPTGTTWSITLGGIQTSGQNSTIVFLESNASYAFTVGTVSGFTVSTASSSVTVDGAPQTVTLTFTANAPTGGASSNGGLTATDWILVAVVVLVVLSLLGGLFFGRRGRDGALTPQSAPAPPPEPAEPDTYTYR
jgi:DNA-binding beta-propeller fold protein YncE